MSLFNILEGIRSKINESMQAATLLASLGSNSQSPYRAVISSPRTISDVDLTWEKFTPRLLQEYSTRKAQSPGEEPSSRGLGAKAALKANASKLCYNCNRPGQFKRNCLFLRKNDHRKSIKMSAVV